MNQTIYLGKVAITPRGTWNQSTSYEALTEIVYENDGCGYVSLKPNVAVTPGTDPTVWMLAVQAGKSIYQLAVVYGYEGTEEEFVAAYNQAVAAAQTAADSANTKMAAFSLQEQTRQSNETARVNAEIARGSAENTRDRNESTRQSNEAGRNQNETERQSAETLREQSFNATKQACDTAAALAGEKAEEASDAANLANEKADLANTKAGIAQAAAEDVLTPAEVLAEHIAKIENDVAALMERIDQLGDARARSLTLDTLPKICGKDFYTEGAGAPTVAGACEFAEYYDTTNGIFYKYNGSAWMALN